jgi:hypothetical protein
MNNDYIYLTGKAKWVKVITPNKYDKWSMDLYPTPPSYDKIVELKSKGLKNHLRKDDDGYYMTFTRPTSKIIRGKLQGFQPPIVLDKNGLPIGKPSIGNGSDVTIKAELYEYKIPLSKNEKGIACRLESIRVDNLVPFETKRDFDEDQKSQISGLSEQPEPLF